MVINSNTLLGQEEYVPKVGLEYQVAEKVLFVMPEPTQNLAEQAQAKLIEFYEMAEEERTYEQQLAIAILISGKPLEAGDSIPPVVQVFMMDFFTIARKITDALLTYAKRLNPSNEVPEES